MVMSDETIHTQAQASRLCHFLALLGVFYQQEAQVKLPVMSTGNGKEVSAQFGWICGIGVTQQ